MLFKHLHLVIKRTFATKPTPHQQALMARGLPKKQSLPGVEHIVVVASGKGGVGKSTVAVNLAVSLARVGNRVGLLDGDIFGPSIPLMMDLHEQPLINEKNEIIPPLNFGVKCLSMGLLTKQDDAIVWRGPLVMSALQRLLKGAVWGPLDILIVDTPPGTGDVHLSLAQNVPLAGVLLVSTPQVAALEVTLRGAQMYRKLNVPIFGLVENMGHAICENCKQRMEIYKNFTQEFASKIETQVLASIPLDPDITSCCDSGVPVVVKYPQSNYTQSFQNLANNIIEKLNKRRDDEKQRTKDEIAP